MWFVVPEPGLTQQSSWEALLGLWGEELRAGEAGWRGLAVWWSWVGEPLTRGIPPGQPWSCLEAGNGD